MDKRILPNTPWTTCFDAETLKKVSLAFKSLETGTANDGQQKLALDFLIRMGCRTYDSDWFDDDRMSSFAAGRRYVGMQIVDMINLNTNTLKEKKHG